MHRMLDLRARCIPPKALRDRMHSSPPCTAESFGAAPSKPPPPRIVRYTRIVRSSFVIAGTSRPSSIVQVMLDLILGIARCGGGEGVQVSRAIQNFLLARAPERRKRQYKTPTRPHQPSNTNHNLLEYWLTLMRLSRDVNCPS